MKATYRKPLPDNLFDDETAFDLYDRYDDPTFLVTVPESVFDGEYPHV